MAKTKKKKLRNPELFMSPAAQNDEVPEQEKEPSDILPLDEDGPNSYDAWIARLKKSDKKIETLQPEWDKLQRIYNLSKRTSQGSEELNIPTCFSRTETKKSELVAQNPRVIVSAKRPESVSVAPLMEAVLNDQLSAAQPDGVDAMVMFEEIMPDVLVSAGIFGVHIGYELISDGTKEIQVGEQPDPNWQPPDPSTLPPGMPPPKPPMIPQMETVPNVVRERYFMDRLSPSKLRIPDDFTGSDYDRAPWLSFKFRLDFYLAAKKWELPEDFEAFAGADEDVIDGDSEDKSRSATDKRKIVEGYMVYYKTAIFDSSVLDPFRQRCLVLVKGLKKPVYHKDSPYQWQEPDGSLGGMVGFPIHIGALRYVSDSAFPKSDAAMAKDLFEEIDDGRSKMRQHRKRSVLNRVANIDLLKEAGLAKFQQGQEDAIIPLPGACFPDGKFVGVQTVETTHFPQENFTFDNIANRSVDECYGLGSAPGGSLPTGTASTSATQASAAQQSSGSRIGRERNKLMGWYARAVEKLAPLYQRFMTDTQYVNLVGADGAKVLTAWNKDNIAGKFGFSILPNSSIDMSEQRQEELDWYNLAARAPDINRRQLDTDMVQAFGKDPAKLINPPAPPPPPPKPELPKGMNFALDEKINPMGPSFPLIIAMLRQWGWQIPDEMIADMQRQAMQAGVPVTKTGDVANGQIIPPPQPQPGQPGALPPGAGAPAIAQPQSQNGAAALQVEPIEKHTGEKTGGLPGPKPN